MRKLEKTFANCGCLLRCMAVPLTGGGGFHAQVEIVQYGTNKLLVEKRIVASIPLPSVNDAIECARDWSMNWVRQYS
jgi:hypothetical protein